MSQTETLHDTRYATLPTGIAAVEHEFQRGAVETIPEAGLTVIRGALTPEQTASFEAELAEIMKYNFRPRPENDITKVHEDVNQLGYPSETLTYTDYKVLSSILRKLGMVKGHKVVINHQSPNGKQKFHADDHPKVDISDQKPLLVIHASDGGSLDYAIDADPLDPDDVIESKSVAVPVNAGDIVIQTKADLLHRGRNMSDHDRYNIVVFNIERPPLSLEDAIRESQNEVWE